MGKLFRIRTMAVLPQGIPVGIANSVAFRGDTCTPFGPGARRGETASSDKCR